MRSWKAALPQRNCYELAGEKGGIEAAKQGHNVVMTPEDSCTLIFLKVRMKIRLTYGQYITP